MIIYIRPRSKSEDAQHGGRELLVYRFTTGTNAPGSTQHNRDRVGVGYPCITATADSLRAWEHPLSGTVGAST